jgi:hypothetical protein
VMSPCTTVILSTAVRLFILPDDTLNPVMGKTSEPAGQRRQPATQACPGLLQ